MHLNQLLTSPSKKLAALLGVFCFGVLIGPLCVGVPFEWMITAMTVVSLLCVVSSEAKRSRETSKSQKSARSLDSQSSLEMTQGAKIRFILIIIIALLLGIFRYSQSEIPPYVTTIADRTNQTIRIEGIVVSEVEQKIGGQQVTLNRLAVADEPVDGKLLVSLSLYPRVQYGDRLQLSCRPQIPEPFGGFAYDRYLLSRGVLATCSFPQFVEIEQPAEFSVIGALLSVKHFFVDRLHTVVTEPHASFLSGLLFGGGSSLSRDLQDQFSKTGTSHILAASGFNVSLFSVAFLGWILTTRLKRSQALSVAGVLLVIYMVLAGAVPAVVRATIMASLVLVQHAVRREPYRLNLLLIAATIMLLANPRILLDDPGFQLSFVATVGILYLVPLWKDRFDFLPDRFGLRESFVASLVATICTFPIMLWHFGSISLIAPLVNLLVLPLVPYAMFFTVVAIIGSIVWIPLGRCIAIPALGFSTMILKLVKIFGSI